MEIFTYDLDIVGATDLYSLLGVEDIVVVHKVLPWASVTVGFLDDVVAYVRIIRARVRVDAV